MRVVIVNGKPRSDFIKIRGYQGVKWNKVVDRMAVHAKEGVM